MGDPLLSLRHGAAALAAMLLGWLGASPAQAGEAFTYSDTTIGYRVGPSYREPGIAANKPKTDGADISKNIVSLFHADGYKYGENFFNVDGLFSDHRDPTAAAPGAGSTQGATEVYIVYRHNLSLNAVTDSDMFKVGNWLRDVRFEAGGDFNTKNTLFAPAKKLIVAGPNFAFNFGQFFNVGLHIAHEWNNNGIVGRSVSFDPTFEMEIVWGMPFHVLGERFKFEGFANVVAPKGKDGFGAQTETEFLLHSKLKYDFGKLMFNKEHVFEGGVGLEYWINKFGNDHTKVPGSQAVSPFLFVNVYFN